MHMYLCGCVEARIDIASLHQLLSVSVFEIRSHIEQGTHPKDLFVSVLPLHQR